MKFLMAVFVYLVIGAVIGWGIFSAVNGSYWILAASLIAYVLAFARIGCAHG
jgi:hypothetical protein